MSLAHAPEIVSVWTDGDRPARLVWRGIRYLVTDDPEPLVQDVVHDALTHPGTRVVGWRFQATSVVDGDARVFDVHQVAGTRWQLTAVFV
ncbi:hypothetical protein [Leifsonia shinshuensis]|uniref:Uncharacterized protein n=1 Tax=Leifsonia shinshuensis TaxID=150026 RepID=A0A7G6YA56_9MICO|nr:hypothetical protein [Leifsonia shinshuensis]QNE35371.1 hypothetical protein F1C12_09675 [Leifsonia shinshuensis]